MYRVTTPTHTFTLPLDTSECNAIQITYKQGANILTKEYNDGVLPPGMTLDSGTSRYGFFSGKKYRYWVIYSA